MATNGGPDGERDRFSKQVLLYLTENYAILKSGTQYRLQVDLNLHPQTNAQVIGCGELYFPIR